ncbi:hypothetical protein MACH24_15490 [Erythrobacter sp. Dej080120_24]|uniref:DUF2946 family protein n=1 Tax=Erythrobacter sp. Dej080120_24 TaxID=3024837 RepID=UPI00291F4BAA|nr:hypothetical protein MACH24_15490 [Erythrobacter sp. Dej080120_24]
MVALKSPLRRFRLAVFALLLAGLGLNSLAPAGYMIAPSASGWLSVVVCPETNALSRLAASPPADMHTVDHAVDHVVDHAAMGHGQESDSGSTSAAKAKDCAFGGTLKLTTGPVDPELLVAAILFVLLLGLAPSRPIFVNARPYLRPPLRGPPVPI